MFTQVLAPVKGEGTVVLVLKYHAIKKYPLLK
jgi:hypothetical protein